MRNVFGSLEWFAKLIRRVGRGLPAPLFVTLHGAHVCDLDNYRLAEWTGEAGRVRVVIACESEATAACITSTQSWLRTECELVHGSGVASSTDTAS